jgi:hypothetical protein
LPADQVGMLPGPFNRLLGATRTPQCRASQTQHENSIMFRELFVAQQLLCVKQQPMKPVIFRVRGPFAAERRSAKQYGKRERRSLDGTGHVEATWRHRTHRSLSFRTDCRMTTIRPRRSNRLAIRTYPIRRWVAIDGSCLYWFVPLRRRPEYRTSRRVPSQDTSRDARGNQGKRGNFRSSRLGGAEPSPSLPSTNNPG